MRSRHFKALAVLLLLCAAAPWGHAQERAAGDARTRSGDFYTCPMHPEVKSKKKGTCPKCKMDLRLTKAEAEAKGAAPAEREATGGASAESTKMSIPDVELLDQDGRKVHFYSDLVKGKVVAVQFIFTTCTTICPPLGATFARVQQELGGRAGRDVHLISVSVDPTVDTPERMKAWGEKFHAGPGWTFVTGAKPQVDEVLRALGAASASPADHSPMILIGNDKTGQWTRTYGLTRPALLVKLIDDAAAARLDQSSASTTRD